MIVAVGLFVRQLTVTCESVPVLLHSNNRGSTTGHRERTNTITVYNSSYVYTDSELTNSRFVLKSQDSRLTQLHYASS